MIVERPCIGGSIEVMNYSCKSVSRDPGAVQLCSDRTTMVWHTWHVREVRTRLGGAAGLWLESCSPTRSCIGLFGAELAFRSRAFSLLARRRLSAARGQPPPPRGTRSARAMLALWSDQDRANAGTARSPSAPSRSLLRRRARPTRFGCATTPIRTGLDSSTPCPTPTLSLRGSSSRAHPIRCSEVSRLRQAHSSSPYRRSTGPTRMVARRWPTHIPSVSTADVDGGADAGADAD